VKEKWHDWGIVANDDKFKAKAIWHGIWWLRQPPDRDRRPYLLHQDK
jgi:hypothetical protein